MSTLTARTMRRGIATVSLSGLLAEKLAAAAAAGLDGVEIFDNDLIASPLSPREVAIRCADLGLTIDLFQPVRDVEGLTAEAFARARHRMDRKLAVAAELGAPTVLVCSNVQADAIDDPDLSAEQLAELGELAASYGIDLAFEALAWGRHVDRIGQAWEIVQRADHPRVKVAVDTFHMLSKGDGAEALAGIPGERIGFLQVADAPVLDMNVLEWSRHHRSFPGQGTLPVAAVVRAVRDAGYSGPLSLEVFSDVVREVPALDTARDAARSLAYLEDAVLRLEATGATGTPATPDRIDAAFVELPAHNGLDDLLPRLGFSIAGWHQHKPVAWWRNGAANVLVNHKATQTALAVSTTPPSRVAERARALEWPTLTVDRAPDDAPLPGLRSPAGAPLLISGGGAEDWRHDFPSAAAGSADGWSGIDHIGLAVRETRLNEEVAFLRTVLGMEQAATEEFIDPHGRLRSRAFRPAQGDLRLVVNVVDVDQRRTAAQIEGVNQLAFACDDLLAEVRRLRAAGVPLLAPPANYYADLDARFDLPADLLAELRGLGVFYDRVGDGELLHVFTPVFGPGFYIELLERRGGYDGYGSANTHVRLAAQA